MLLHCLVVTGGNIKRKLVKFMLMSYFMLDDVVGIENVPDITIDVVLKLYNVGWWYHSSIVCLCDDTVKRSCS